MSKEIEAHVLEIYEIKTFLGSGAYGHVWKVQHRITQKEYALKKIFDAFQNDVDAQRTYREVTILPQLDHQNIVKLHEVIKANNGKDLYLVFQFMETDLHAVLGEKILQQTHIKFIAYQLCKVLKYLHSAHLIHRDLKSSNVLLNSSCEIKICDFGLVRSLIREEDTEVILSEDVATRWYRSPEMLLGSQQYGKPTDMWSVGCILAQLLKGEPIFPGSSTLHQLQKIIEFTGTPSKDNLKFLQSPSAQIIISQIRVKKRSLKSYIGDCGEDIKEMILKMLEFDPTQRITAEQALQLPCLQQFRGKSKQHICHKFITTQIDDNVRLSLEEYRRKIYCDIERKYPISNITGTIMPRINRSYHSVESKSFHQYRKIASNSLIKLQKNSTYHQQNYEGIKDQNPHKIYKKTVKYPKRSYFQKENHNSIGLTPLNHSNQSFHQEETPKIYKRKIRGNLWPK